MEIKIRIQENCLSETGLSLFSDLLGEHIPELQDIDTLICDLPALSLLSYFKECSLINGVELQDQVRLVQCWSLGPHVDHLTNKYHLLVMLKGGGTLYSIKPSLKIEEVVMKTGTAVILPNFLPHAFIADNTGINRFAMIQLINYEHF